jgi:predicted small metal-binding protein
MAKLLDCRDMELECDYICAETESEILTRAARYARLDETRTEIPSEFEDRVRSVLRTIDHC